MRRVSQRDLDGLPPGQQNATGWPLLHYGRVPRFDAARWDLAVSGATADGTPRTWLHQELRALPQVEVVAAIHCVTRTSMGPATWGGISVSTLLDIAPPADGVRDVVAWATYGYSASLLVEDLRDPRALLASHRDGQPLTPEQGWPYRLVVPHLYGWKGPKWLRGLEYVTEPRRGFWEERGYHLRGRVWAEERYAHQEEAAPAGPGAPATGS
jgi:DMSO/TMAO reductase YedYZ molybdopterin-dependent catalytic subunit